MTRLAAAVFAVALLAGGCSTDSDTSSTAPTGQPKSASSASQSAAAAPSSPAPASTPSSTAPPAAPSTTAADRSTRPKAADATVLAVGDIARCVSHHDERTAAITAALLRTSPKAPVLAMGDLAYPDGSSRDYATCYRPSWGRFDAHLRPVPGNHEYRTPGASGYFDYFGTSAGPRGKGWYSFDVGAWHVVALNSNCDAVGCGPDSPQVRWLRADLAQHPSRCTLAYWHHPRFSSGEHGSDRDVATLWSTLEKAGADVVLNGHDHDYERFAPQRADGRADPRGIREFVVGTGGGERRVFAATVRNSQKRMAGVDAVLQLRLRDGAYGWALVGSAGVAKPLDAGTGTCS